MLLDNEAILVGGGLAGMSEDRDVGERRSRGFA